MPKSLADGKIKLTMLASAPDDINAIQIGELTAGEDISCDILSSDYSLGPTDSEAVSEKPLCVEGNVNVPGAANFGTGRISPFRYYDATTGLVDETEDGVFQDTKEKGTTLYLVERESAKESTADWTEDDEYNYYEVLTDSPQRIDMTGYIKRAVPVHVQKHALYKTVVANAI